MEAGNASALLHWNGIYIQQQRRNVGNVLYRLESVRLYVIGKCEFMGAMSRMLGPSLRTAFGEMGYAYKY